MWIVGKDCKESKRAFVVGRLIQDNIIVAHEVYHDLNNKRKLKKVVMIVNVDMNKAYDRLEWEFIEEAMRKMGFGKKCLSWIMVSIKSVTMSLENGYLGLW